MGLFDRFRRRPSDAGDPSAVDGPAAGDRPAGEDHEGAGGDDLYATAFVGLRALVDGGASTGEQRAEIARVLGSHGVPEGIVAEYVDAMVDGIALRPSGAADGPLRLCGTPVLPPGEAWPTTSEGRPLTFVAALDLAAVPPSPPLPDAGVLLVFWDEEFGESDRIDFVAATRVFLVPAGERPQPADPPVGIARLAPVGLTAARMPFPASTDGGRLDEDDVPGGVPGYELEDALRQELGHRLLGAETPIQGPVLDEVAYWFDHVAPSTRDRYSAAERTGEDWVLLAQIDEDGGLTFGDVGALYLVLPRIDLESGRFDRVMGIMQCT